MSERSRLCLLPAALLLCGTALADSLVDPMRPWQAARAPDEVSRAAAVFRLSAILYSADRRVAIINGLTVGEGDRVGRAQVRRIRRRSLDLVVDGRTIELALADKPRKTARRSSR